MDKFFFFCRSANKPPGEGVNETGNPDNYSALAVLGEWRKTLSNLHVCSITGCRCGGEYTWSGYRWRSIEHAFQAMKAGLQDNDRAFNFTLDSGHFIGKGDGATAQNHRNVVVLTQENNNLWAAKSSSIMHDITRAKYAQCPNAAAVLDATLDAELWHVGSRGRSHRFEHLESIRSRTRAAAKCAPVRSQVAERAARATTRATLNAEKEEENDDDESFYVQYH